MSLEIKRERSLITFESKIDVDGELEAYVFVNNGLNEVSGFIYLTQTEVLDLYSHLKGVLEIKDPAPVARSSDADNLRADIHTAINDVIRYDLEDHDTIDGRIGRALYNLSERL